MNLAVVGHWALIIGITIAVLAGLTEISYLMPILFILGLIVGFLNIKEKETSSFLLAVVALLAIGLSGLQIEAVPATVDLILENFIAFISAAGLVVALKQIFVTARPGEK